MALSSRSDPFVRIDRSVVRPASELGMTLTGTYTIRGVTYREPLVNVANGDVYWPGTSEWSKAIEGAHPLQGGPGPIGVHTPD